VSNLLLSPAADRAVLRVSRPGSVQTTIVGGGRPMVTIDGDWSPIGWAGKDQIVLRGSAQPTVLVVASIDGTVVRSLMR
jgi:hypothetical protein